MTVRLMDVRKVHGTQDVFLTREWGKKNVFTKSLCGGLLTAARSHRVLRRGGVALVGAAQARVRRARRALRHRRRARMRARRAAPRARVLPRRRRNVRARQDLPRRRQVTNSSSFITYSLTKFFCRVILFLSLINRRKPVARTKNYDSLSPRRTPEPNVQARARNKRH